MRNQLRFGKLFCGVILAGLLPVLVAGNTAAQQKQQGGFVDEPTQRLVKLINKANDQGYSLLTNKLSMGGGWIKQGADNWVHLYNLPLIAGNKYRFLAAGDFDSTDVDLRVKDANGDVVAQDVGTSAEAVVDYTAKNSAPHKVEVRLYASKNNTDCVCMAISMVLKKK